MKWNQCTGGWKETKVPWLHMSLASVWWNWCVMCDEWVIDLYVIILVEMKPVYWGLKGNQGTMVTYVFICFSMMKLMCYCDDWVIDLYVIISYGLVCNHFGWNETSVLGVERKPRYHGYICLYLLQYDEIDVLCVMTEL